MSEKHDPSREDKVPYWQKVRAIEKEMFPEFKDEDFCIDSPETNNFYFSPSHNFRSGLMTGEHVESFKKDLDKKMLSVGSGPAFLERLLVKMGVDKDSITLSDINSLDLPDDLKKEVFDMLEDWPDFEDDFNLIIFPECPAFNIRYQYGEERSDGFVSVFAKALDRLKEGGEIRITGNPNSVEITNEVQRKLVDAGYEVEVDNVSAREKHGSLIVVKKLKKDK